MGRAEAVRKPVMSALAYSVGSERRAVSTLEDFEQRCKQVGLERSFDSLGVDAFFENRKPGSEFIGSSIEKTLELSGARGSEIDAVVFASADVASPALDHSEIHALFKRFGLARALPVSASLQQCASGLSGSRVAAGLLDSRSTQRVLLVVVEQTRRERERERLQSYAVFSDAVASCVLAWHGAGIELIDHATRADSMALLDYMNVQASSKIYRDSLEELTGAHGLGTGDIKVALATNFFAPVALYYAMICGLDYERVFRSSWGHCGACDPFINFVDGKASGRVNAGDLCVLQSYAPGVASNCLARVTAG